MDPVRGPQVVRRTQRGDGLLIAHQPAPASARSSSATFLAPAGSAYDPPRARGLALALGLLLTSGAGTRDRVAFAQELDRLGGTLSVQTDPESIEVTVWGPTDVFPALFGLLADVILRPRFTTSDLDRVRRQLFERQQRERSQPHSRAELELLRAIFPVGHPYRETGLGDRRSVAALTTADARRFHRDHFTPQGSILVLSGPGTLERSLTASRRHFHDFARDRAPAAPAIPPPAVVDPAPRRIELPGRAQVELRMGGPTLPRSAPEYPAVFLANEVLGGRSMLSRLFQRVRESNGLAYHATSELEAMRWGGHWMAAAGTGPERSDAVIELLREEVERIRAEPVPSAELERIRESAIGELTLGLETTAGAHDLALDIVYHGLPDDHLLRWPGQLRALDAESVRRAADSGMERARTATVIAGPSSPAP
jgi:zinc protease